MDHARYVHGGEATIPTMPGQEAFGTIQEIVRILETDPATGLVQGQYRRSARAPDRHG
jgi:hypothetical protein